MKIFSVIGLSESGKTTTIENIIRELKKRGYSVGTIKDIHFHEFKMDAEGTNTHKHRDAGAQLVTARAERETTVLFQEKLPINRILQLYNHDFVVMEGVRDTSAVKIVTAHDIEGIEARLDDSVIAVSGRIAAEMDSYKGLPVINSMTHIKELVDLIEEKSFSPLPEMKEGQCKACGYSCKELGARISKGLSKREDCRLTDPPILLKVNGLEISMVPFVQRILINAVEAVAKELSGYLDSGDIELYIKR